MWFGVKVGRYVIKYTGVTGLLGALDAIGVVALSLATTKTNIIASYSTNLHL